MSRQSKGLLDAKTALAKWDVLAALSESPQAPTALAKKLNKSLPGITQQLKLLEALGFVRLDHMESTGPGKPRTIYALTNDVLVLATLTKQRLIKPSPFETYLANIILLGSEDTPFLIKIAAKDDFFGKVQGLGLVKTTKDTIELFVLTDSVDDLRKKYSSFPLTDMGRTKNVVCWTHAFLEVQEGLQRKDPHFVTLFNSSTTLYDPEGKLRSL